MHWILALLGAFFGYAIGDASRELLGLLLGAFAGWQGARLMELRQRIAKLEQRPAQRAPAAEPTSGFSAQQRATEAAQSMPAATASAAQAVSPTPPVKPAEPASAQPAPASPPNAPTAPVEGVSAAARASTAAAPRAPEQVASASASAAAPASAAASAPASISASKPTPGKSSSAPTKPGNGLEDRITGFLRRALLEGNIPVKIGALLLFFGVAAALKYAADQGYFTLPIEFRLAGFAVAAIGALLWGWRYRQSQPAFGLSLQGLGIGVLLLVVFASFALYHVLPAGMAFGIIIFIVAAAALLAVLQDAIWLAALGFVGGYLAPVLINTGSGNHVALFSYYALLNAAVFGIAWTRPWRLLNLIGFAFTFIVGGAWGWQHYQPEKFATVEPFLILFFVFYSLIPVLYALRQSDDRRGIVDGTLLFGTPLVAFPMQAALLADDRYGLAFSALAVAAWFVLIGRWLIRRRHMGTLGQSFAILAAGFATLAIPLALSANWTAASWALEGAAMVWLGQRQNRMLPRISGLILQVLAAGAYVLAIVDGLWDADAGEWLLLNGHALSTLCLALAAGFIGWSYDRHRPLAPLSILALCVALWWWFVFGLREISEFKSMLSIWTGDAFPLWLAWLAASMVLITWLRSWLPWYRLGWAMLPMIALLPVLVFAAYGERSLLLSGLDLLAWPLLFVILGLSLRKLREPLARGLSWMHVGALWGLACWLGIGLLQWSERVERLGQGWSWLLLVAPLALLLFGNARRPPLFAWPMSDHFDDYRSRWLIPASAVLGLLWFVSLFNAGDSAPLPFVPLLNPLELMQVSVLVLAASATLHAEARATNGWRQLLLNGVLPASAFAFISMACLRAVHHIHGVSWSGSLLEDNVAQTSLTVVWSICGVLAWVIGSRQRRWSVWLLGAILFGVVLAKLVLVDRHYWGNLAGIVSFLAVGGLLVLVGKLAPTPPRDADNSSSSAEGESA